MDATERVAMVFAESAKTCMDAAESLAAPVQQAAEAIVRSLLGGGKVLSCGNGSSAADAQYFAAQMAHKFSRERPGLPAVALNSDAAILTAIAVDEGFSEIYAKQISALGHPGDILLTLSVSGTAENVVAAIQAAQERQLQIVALTGGVGGPVADLLRPSNIEIRSPCDNPARVLENHRVVIHSLCELVDLQLMGG